MFEGLYGNLQKKAQKRGIFNDEEVSLEFFLKSGDDEDQETLIKSYVHELKELLYLDSVIDLIEGINAIQATLNKIQDKYIGLEVPSFFDFYNELSPLLLQKFWERGKNPDPNEPLDMIFLESIHIALEEEIYIWQEKISQ